MNKYSFPEKEFSDSFQLDKKDKLKHLISWRVKSNLHFEASRDSCCRTQNSWWTQWRNRATRRRRSSGSTRSGRRVWDLRILATSSGWQIRGCIDWEREYFENTTETSSNFRTNWSEKIGFKVVSRPLDSALASRSSVISINVVYWGLCFQAWWKCVI